LNANGGVGEVIKASRANSTIVESDWVVSLTVGNGNLSVTKIVGEVVPIVASGASVAVYVVSQTELN
jgi:hypothetical protein